MTNRGDLTRQLDPDRDYGHRSFEEVVAGVHKGTLLLEEGLVVPVIRDATTGQVVKGTGQSIAEVDNIEGKRAWSHRFQQLGRHSFDELYEQLIDLCRSGNFKALEYFFNRMSGKPSELRTEGSTKATELLIEKLGQTTQVAIPSADGEWVPVERARLREVEYEPADSYEPADPPKKPEERGPGIY